jgi:plastocyanin
VASLRNRFPGFKRNIQSKMRFAGTTFQFAAVASALVFIAACGGDDEIKPVATVTVVQDTAPAPTQELQTQPSPSQPLDASASSAEDGIIAIEVRGALFVPNYWTVTLGETNTITVANADTQEHNLRIAGLDGAYDTEDDALTAPNPLPGGESGELTFAPLVPGDYTFRCDYHPDTMGGRIEVEAGVP